MLSNFTESNRRASGRASRLVPVAMIVLALLIITSSARAASPQQGAVDAQVNSSTGGQVQASSPNANCPGGLCFTDVIATNPFSEYINRIYQQDLVGGYPCGGQGEPCDAQNRPYYRPTNDVNRQQMAKFIDNARRLAGIDIEQASGITPIFARNDTGDAISAQTTSGVALRAIGTNNTGVYAVGGLLGVAGTSTNGYGVSGESTGNGVGVRGIGVNGIGVRGTSTNYEGVYGETGSSHAGVYGHNTSGASQAPGVRGDGTAGPGVYGFSTGYYGVFGQSQTSLYAGVYGNNTALFGYGVQGVSSTGYGVDGESTSNAGVRGLSSSSIGVAGQGAVGGVSGLSGDGYGVSGNSTNGYGVYGVSTNNYAGYFAGNVEVTGSCCAMGQAYTRIDDPLDSANKYLNQALVQSPNMTTVINGNVVLDSKGEAIVSTPEWFGASNNDFRYTLTAVSAPSPNLYVAQKLAGNRFKIAGGTPSGEVSWQVTGIRQDAYANAHPIQVEQEKPANEKGKYLHPTEFGQPESLGVDYISQQNAHPQTAP